MNLEEIGKYIEWKNRWSQKDNIDIYQYISFNIHPDDILIIGKLLFPEIIEIENCILLKDNYDYFLYENLKKKYNNSSEIEFEINKLYLYDLFAHCTDITDDKLFKNIGEFLQFSWSIYFKHKFPNKNIIIECISNTHNYGDILSFYTKS
jgi:hypothetical protein